MHQNQIGLWQHQHTFSTNKQHIEKKTLIVVIITFTMMIAEIFFGWISNSMALLADGWHMGTHVFALGISLIAYIIARKHAKNSCFVFGTWKIEILGVYTNALLLGTVSVIMIYSSIERLINTLQIHYNQALLVAIVGLGANVVCAIILNTDSHSHTHQHNHDDSCVHEHHSHNDLNLKSAYLHIIADALTSVFAICALIGVRYLGLNWLDPFMGIIGAALIARWAILLLRDSASILLDHEKESPLSREIKEQIESDGDTRISDLHLWKVADGKYACIISVVAAAKYSIEEHKKKLDKVHELVHITIEVNECKKNIVRTKYKNAASTARDKQNQS